MKTKIAVLYKCGQPLVIEELEIPPLTKGQVLVKVLFSGVCGTQLAEVEGKGGPDKYLPHSLGHEGSGVVQDVGEGVSKVRIGDHVIISWIKGSGLSSSPPSFYKEKQKINAGFSNTFTEFSIISENRLVPISKDMPLDKASILGCAVATGAGAVFNVAKIPAGSSVLVAGTGGVGFNVIQAASLANASKIIVCGRTDSKLKKSKLFGATDLLNFSDGDIEFKVKTLTDGKGVDFSFDAVGEPSITEFVFRSARNDIGKVVLLGDPGYQKKISIAPGELFSGKTIIATNGGSCNPDFDFPKFVKLYLSGKFKLDQMITHRFKLYEINDALSLLKKGGAIGRAILEL